MSRTLECVVVAAVLAGSTVYAITRLDVTSQIYLKLADDRIATSPDQTGVGIKPSNGYSVRSNQTTEIWIFDPNPLLFTYQVKTVLTETEDYKQALEFAKSLSTLLGRFPQSAGSGRVEDSVVEGLGLVEFRDHISTLQADFSSIPRWIDQSLDAATAKKMKDEVRDTQIAEIADAVKSGYQKAWRIWAKCLNNEALAGEDGLSVPCNAPFDVRPLVRQRQLTLQLQRATGDRDDARAAKEAADALADDLAKKSKAAQDALDTAKKKKGEKTDALEASLADAKGRATRAQAGHVAATDALTTRQKVVEQVQGDLKEATDRDVPAALAKAAAGFTIREFISYVIAGENHVTTTMTVLRGFAKDVGALLVPRKLEECPYSLQRQTVTVTVAAETRYDDFLSAEAKSYRDKQLLRRPSFDIVIEPYKVASLRPGVGFVLGFLRDPTFSTAKEGDAFRIVQNDTPLTRYSVAAMLNIVPRGWDEPTFGGFFQVGISPKTDETGFFFGAGISAQSVLTFGGGLMVQQVRQLAPGLSLDRPLTKPEDLKTQNVFKPAFYVHGTVTLPSK